jgi:hypothetical protein
VLLFCLKAEGRQGECPGQAEGRLTSFQKMLWIVVAAAPQNQLLCDMANLTKVAGFVIQLTISGENLAQYCRMYGSDKLLNV